MKSLLKFICGSTTKELKEQIKELTQLAYYDPLTELPNRLNFKKTVNTMLDRAKKSKVRVAFFLIDVDNFKRINDTAGHAIGDDVLIDLGKHLTTFIRTQCPKSKIEYCTCFASRLGGDEFLLVLEQVKDISELSEIATALYKEIQEPFIVDGFDHSYTISTGISLFPYDGTTPSALLKSADLALYDAKNKGKDQYMFYESSMNTKIQEYSDIESVLRYFIDTEDFNIHFQPQIDLMTGKVIGAEALFRGNTIKYPNLALYKLLNIAEETKLIVPLGTHILNRACAEAKLCLMSGQSNVNISVNVSTPQLEDADFVQMVFDTLEHNDLPPECLTIELTESVFMKEIDTNITKMQELSNKGIRLSIDDFGTGYSSMSYIRVLPVNELKLDISFIRNISNPKDLEIVKAIVSMSRNVGLSVVSEGIETPEQSKILRELGCDYGQGYYFSKPLPSEEFCKAFDKTFQT